MKLLELFRPVLRESYEDYRDKPWMHYSKHQMLMVNANAFHNDPAGIYFFPFDYHPTASMWHLMPYRYVAKLKPEARVLDLPRMSQTDIDTLIQAVGNGAQFASEIEQYPPDNHRDMVRMLWSNIRNNAFRFQAKWNKIFRSMGYDAIFDDSGIIHSAEPIQLVVLNPRTITLISQSVMKRNNYSKMKKVVDELTAVCEQFGTVTVEPPTKKRSSSTRAREPILCARVEVRHGEEHYAAFNIDLDHTDKNSGHMIRISLGFSQPRLNYGVGTMYNTATDRWDDREGLARVRNDLQRIFQIDTMSTA